MWVMNWSEIERDALAMKELQEEQRKKDLEEKTAQRVKDREYIQEMLDRLHVSEALEALRDEVWKEGKVTPLEVDPRSSAYRTEAGLMLTSKPFPRIDVVGSGRSLTLRLKEQHTSLAVTVGIAHNDRTNAFRNGVTVTDKDMYVTRTSPDTYSVRRSVQAAGLEDGLNSLLREPRQVSEYDQFEAVGIGTDLRLRLELYNSTENRREYGSFPHQLRETFTSLVDELPGELKTNRHLTQPQLRDWAHQVRGTPKPLVIFERLFGR